MPLVHTIILGPAIANTFLLNKGISVGASLVDTAALPLVKDIGSQAEEMGVKIILPEDLIVASNSLKGPLRVTNSNNILAQDFAVSIGPASQAAIQKIIASAGTVFYNGLMGSLDRPETLQGVFSIFTAMARSSAFSVVAGGDSVAAVQACGVSAKISYLSTGGGATLSYLSGKTLPGLVPFISG